MIDYDLKKVRAVVFDVDGVLSAETITLSSEGEPLRTVNIKDGYAIQLAVRQGLHVAIITGGNTNAVRLRYSGLGVRDIYMKARDKMVAYNDLVERYKPFDKAGAYGIQEWIGYVGVEGIRGSYYNVMGFPVQRVYEEMTRHFGLKIAE